MDIQIARADDWNALYIDGQLEEEDHSLAVVLERLFEILRDEYRLTYQSDFVNQDWIEYEGSFPEVVQRIVWSGDNWQEKENEDNTK